MEKDINFIKEAVNKVNDDSIIKFLIDLVADGIRDAENFEPTKTYKKHDKVYVFTDGKHHIYKCIVDISTPGDLNLDEEWSDLYY